jgi:hypothetical protein
MKKNCSTESGILSLRLLLALGFCSIGAWSVLISVAAPGPNAPQTPSTIITVTTTTQKDQQQRRLLFARGDSGVEISHQYFSRSRQSRGHNHVGMYRR